MSTTDPSAASKWRVTPLPPTSPWIWATTWRTSRSRTALRRRTAKVWAMSARLLDVASAWSDRRATNIVAPIASQSTIASSANAPTIRPVRLLGTARCPAGIGGAGRPRNGLPRRRDEPIADAADGLDRRAVGAKLAADLAHMDVD